MRRHIAADDCASPDHRSFTDCHIGQDHAVRPNEHILLNHNLSISNRSSGSGVEVGNDRCSEADDAVVAYTYVLGMNLIEVNKLADPDILPDRDAAQPLQPRPHTESPRRHEGYFARKPAEQNWQSQRFLPFAPERVELEFGARTSLIPSTAECFRFSAL